MHHHTPGRFGLALLAGGFAVVTAAAIATTSTASTAYASSVNPAAPIAACTVTVTGDSVPVMKDPVIVSAALSSAIGDSITASFPTESNVSVVNVAPAPGGAANSLQLTLNTGNAAPGEWTLALKGTTGECSGKLKVIASP